MLQNHPIRIDGVNVQLKSCQPLQRCGRLLRVAASSNPPIAPNLLERNFTPEAPNQVWTSDITYIATDEGWLYL